MSHDGSVHDLLPTVPGTVVQWIMMRHSHRRFHCERSTIWTKVKGDKSKLLFIHHSPGICVSLRSHMYCHYLLLVQPTGCHNVIRTASFPRRKFDCRYDSLCRSGSFYYRVEAVATFLCLERNELWIPISDRNSHFRHRKGG